MICRYTVLLDVPHGGFWRPVSIGCYRTLERAIRRAEAVLAKHPSEETRNGPRSMGFFCEVWDERKGATLRLNEETALRLSAPRVLVPSVGELGYW
jgi:hypothetical protein